MKLNLGSTTLHIATRFGDTDTVRTLLDHGANVSTKNNRGK